MLESTVEPPQADAPVAYSQRRRVSMQWLLAALIAATALPLIALLGYQMVRETRADNDAARNLVRGLAEVSANDSAAAIRKIERTVRLLAGRPMVRSLDPARCDPALEELRGFEPNFNNVVTFDAAGNPVCSALRPTRATPPNVSTTRWFQRLASSNDIVISSPQKGAYSGRWIAILAHPIRDSRGNVAGAVAVAIDLAAFQPVATAALPPGGVMGIINHEGVIVTRLSQAEESIGRNVAGTNLGRAVLGGAVNTEVITGSDGIERLYAYQPIARSGWFVTVGVPTELVLAKVRQSAWRNGLGALVVIAVAALLVAFTYRRIAAPLVALHDTVRAIADGDRNRRAPVGGPSELAEVATTFNRMMERIPQIEGALSEREEQYRKLFLASPDAIVVTSGRRIVMANPAAIDLFGAGVEGNAIGSSLLDWIHPDFRARAERRLGQPAPESRDLRFAELDILRADETRATAELVVLPFSYGSKPAVLCIFKDISDQRRLEGEILAHRAEAERLVNQLVAQQTAAAIAHELNQPLIAVSAYSEAALAMVRNGGPHADRLAQALEGAASQAQRAGRTLHELLDFLHKSDAGSEPVDLNEVVKDAVAATLAGSPARFVPDIEVANTLPQVLGNRNQLQRVLSNLLQNGIDAMQAGGASPESFRLEVRTALAGDMAQVTVRDNGPGPDGAAKGRLFEPFFTTKPRGIGLGLTISRALIESHGGRLWHDSASGTGGAFHFTLPLAT
jgi:PAS domain S-box-containing protein